MPNLKLIIATLAASILGSTCAYANTVYFYDDFATGNFNEWSFVQGADPSQGGPGPQYVYVTTAAKAGIPARVGPNVANFTLPASLSTTYPQCKIYKEWSTSGKHDQFGRHEDPIFNNGNVSAIYIAWFYFPANYVATTNWTNIFQFKEEGYPTASSANEVQNPSWWINVGPARSFANGVVAQETSTPVLFVNNWGNTYVNYHPVTVPVPLGQWFEISANLYQGDHIDWYLNNKKFDTSYNSTYPVGRYYSKSNEWIFGLGHYQGVGTLYVNHVGVVSLH